MLFLLLPLFFALTTDTFAAEGFYPVDRPPPAYLEEFGISSSVIQRAFKSYGRIGAYYQEKLSDQAAYDSLLAKFRSQPDGWKKWYGENLSNLERVGDCSRGCEVRLRHDNCSGVFLADKLGGFYFVTAQHCVALIPPYDQYWNYAYARATFIAGSGKAVTIRLERTYMTEHRLPYEMAVYEVPKESRSIVSFANFRSVGARPNESVFVFANPNLGSRTRRDPNVPAYDSVLAAESYVSFGKVLRANPNRLSYCAATNYNTLGSPKNWVLALGCTFYNYMNLAFPGAEEKNALIADTEMTYGVSGGPLYNREGELIGIGSTTTAKQALNYEPGPHAVFPKAENLSILFRIEANIRNGSIQSRAPNGFPGMARNDRYDSIK